MMGKIFKIAFFLVFAIAWGTNVTLASEFLTGEWNGARKCAHDAGVDFFLTYANDIAGNPSGGRSQGWTNAGSLDLLLSLDCHKILNIYGLSIYSSYSWASGSNLSAKYINNQFPVQQLFRGETYKLAELFLEESLCNENLNIKLGRLCAGVDFLFSPLYKQYVTAAINSNPISMIYNGLFSTYPFATWGAYLDFRIHSLVVKFGAYNTNINIWKNKYHGINFTFHSQLGAMLINEWAYHYNEKDRLGLKGNYKIGGYYLTGRSDHSSACDVQSNYGIYFLFDQMLRQWVDQSKIAESLTAWGAFVYAPVGRNIFPFFFSLGLVSQGIIASRPNDALSLGVAYGHYSSNIKNMPFKRNFIGAYSNRSQSSETQLELNYCIQATPWLALTPVAQYVINPKGYGNIPNAFVLGIQVEIDI